MIKQLLFVCTTLLFVSCSSDDSNDQDLGIYPDKIYYLYDDLGIGRMDTMEIVTVLYDAQKRVTKLENLYEGLRFEEHRYFYNGSEQHPSKTVHVIYEADPYSDSIVTFHSYDGNNRKTKDSVEIHTQFSSNTVVTNYSYAPGYMYGNTTGNILDTATLDANGNIIHNKKYNYSGTPGLSFESTFTYDNKPHPFARMSNFQSHNRFPLGETFYWDKFSANNFLTQVESTQTHVLHEVQYNYIYRSDGLPTTVNETWDGEPGRWIFTYKNL